MKTTAKKPTESQQVLLIETVDWAGRFLSSYARLKEAERNSDEDAFDEAWGDLASDLLILQEKAQQAHDLLDPEDR
ncbi:hypothetical protein LM602_06220 [Candidatus Acetothermia bacterium]|jgi:hypothetical protein|nr:hypothetical protein [Candidatus Acetothermia bacterium]MCI2432132.1 hypothetical protein [Candidatus Acetothermia bacterium]MCI2436716.1 hypothetical protein [Candidatus Acetothermia bacterium]